jgi:predicted ATPase
MKLLFNLNSSSRNYIVTGGEGVGKTTVIELLRQSGFQVVPEAFTQLYHEAKADGRLQQFLEDPFAQRAALLQVQIAKEKSINTDQIAFLDRSALECIFFAGYYYKKLPEQNELNFLKQLVYNQHVFFLDPLPEKYYEQTEVRRETREQSLNVHELLKQFYQKNNFKIIAIPFCCPTERMHLILKYVKQ